MYNKRQSMTACAYCCSSKKAMWCKMVRTCEKKRDLVRTEFVDKPTDRQGQDRNYKNGYTYENNGHQ